MPNPRSKATIAVGISVLLHGFFFAASGNITLSGMGAAEDAARKVFRMRDVDKTPQEIVLLEDTEQRASFPDRTEMEPLVDPVSLERFVAEPVEKQDLAFARKKEKALAERQMEEEALSRQDISAEDLMARAGEQIKEEAAPTARLLNDVVLSRGPSSIADAPRVILAEPGYKERALHPGERYEEPFPGADRKQVAFRETRPVTDNDVARRGEYEDISSLLEVDLKIYRDPVTGENYFRIEIGIREGARVKALPKELVFLVDSSRSITERRFEHVQAGIRDILTSLDERDRFNIIAFKHEREEFAATSVRATTDNIRDGIRFTNSLTADGRTDIEDALLGIVQMSPEIKPSYVLLISDGRPTEGVMDPEEIIRTITRENAGRRPVFSFGVGLRVSNYLLDLISYQNRAWSEFAVASDSARGDLMELYEKIRYPLLTDLRYRLSGMDPANIFPGQLPDFYHSTGLVVYGKYTDEDIFSMQMLGESEGTVKEFIFTESLKEASKGTREIQRSWALSKIYDIIGSKTTGLGDPHKQKRDLEALGREYNIDIPYLNRESI